MQVLLCSLNSKYVHSSLSVWYLAESVRQNCAQTITVNILEGTVNQPGEEIVQKIAGLKPDVLAFSCYIWNISFILKLIPQIKKFCHAVVVLGGPEVSFNPEEVLNFMPNVDYIISGEGELPFPLLMTCLQSGGDPGSIPGLCFRSNTGSVQCNPPATPVPEPPSPYSEAYLQNLDGRIAYLETSRGCPFSCAFCLSGIGVHNVRFFSLERAKKELLLMANSGAQTVKLVDRTFNCNHTRAFALFRFIIENAGKTIPPGVCFHFEVAADLFDRRTLDLLATAPPGLIQLEAGLQSFNPETLQAVNRKTDLIKVEENIRALLAGGNMHIHIDLIAGLPYEGLDSFSDSFDRAYALSPHMLQLGFLKMLHGSTLRSQAQELGYRYSPLPPYEAQSNSWLPQEDMQTISRTEHALQKLYNSGRFLLTLEYALKVTGARPFALFCAFGEKLPGIHRNASLNEFAQFAYSHFCSLPGMRQDILRDRMVCDFLACGSKLPDFLKIRDKRYKTAVNKIRGALPGTQKINAALLYAEGFRVVYSCGPKDAVTGRHPLHIVSAD